MQISFYGKTYSFSTKDQLYRVMDDIYYRYQDLKRDIPKQYQQKVEKDLQKLERDFEDIYRKLKNIESDLKNSKGEDMGYYAKLVEEKRNSNSFLLGLKNKIFKSTDDLERVLKTFTVDCKVLDEDADGIKVQVLQRDGNHTYKIYLAAYLGGPHEDVIVEKVVKLNSKENSMNYYAKLAEEKQNSTLVATEDFKNFTIKGYHFSGNNYSYYSYRKGSSMSLSYASGNATSKEEALREAKSSLERHNSKDQKENSTVLRGTIHGHKYEVDRMSDGSYMGYVYDEEDFPIFKTSLHSTAAGAEKEIKGKVFNSKEEKTNDMFTYLGKRFAVTKGSYEHVRKEVEQTYRDKIAELERKAQTATGSEKSKIEADIRDIKSGWRETLANLRMMVENSKGYYAELIEKKNASRKTEVGKFELTGEDKTSFFIRMDSWIEAESARRIGKSRYDCEFDRNDGILTVWLDPKKNHGYKKEFYKVIPFARKREIREDGSIYYMQEDFELKYGGAKL